MKKDTVCIVSGGMDSYTLLNEIHSRGRLAAGLSFDYGQRHKKELSYAQAACAQLGVPHRILDLCSLGPCLLGSALTDEVPVPEGHYTEESMKQTVVPNRNAIMLSIAVAYAVSHEFKRVCFGAHNGDHAIYPDCRPEFVSAINTVSLIANWHPVAIEAPYLELTKVEILRIGNALGLDYSRSWTCYKGEEKACGKCGSCQERLEAFAVNGWVDPLEYAA